ncbi:hypothetical protein ACOZWD_000241 [Cronobacter sakazakii]
MKINIFVLVILFFSFIIFINVLGRVLKLFIKGCSGRGTGPEGMVAGFSGYVRYQINKR